MRRISNLVFIFFAFTLFHNNAKAQIEPSILTVDSLPYTLDQPIQYVFLNVNSDEDVEFLVIFELNPSPSPGETEYLTGIESAHESGLLIEPERFAIPPIFPPLPEIEASHPLTDLPSQTIEYPYMSLFSQGVRIENRSPNHESSWGNFGMLAGDISTLFHNDNKQAPLNSSYIDGVLGGYVGARYTKDGQTYYGWIEISVDDSAPSITIESMSFEAIADRRSYTGIMSVVPITFISSLIGFFAIGVGVYFRRRKIVR